MAPSRRWSSSLDRRGGGRVIGVIRETAVDLVRSGGDLARTRLADRAAAWWSEIRGMSPTDLGVFLTQVGKLLVAILRDEEVTPMARAAAAGALAYVASPIDVLPDVIPGVGRVDDVWLVSRALRLLAKEAGVAKLAEHWTGSHDGFRLVLTLAGMRDPGFQRP